MATARVNDIEIYFEVRGAGAPLVLIPGLGSDISMLQDIIDSLAADCEVLAFDPRGAGRSDKPDVPYSIGTMADDTAALMDAAGMPSAHIVGISMGGRIAQELALRHAGRVRSLVLVSTSARTPWTQGKTRRRHVLDELLGLPIVRRLGLRPHDPHLRQREAFRGLDSSDRLHAIHVPTLILHGRRDTVVSHAFARKMAARIDGSRMVTFDSGHLFFLEEHEPDVVTTIRAFVNPD